MLVCAGTALCGSRAMAQQASDPSSNDVQAQLSQQEQEIHQLRDQLAGIQQGATVTPTAFSNADATAATAAAADPAAPYVVGSDTTLTAHLHDGFFLWLETPNKDFTMHIGAWMQYDNVWWNQGSNVNITSAKGSYSGSGAGTGFSGTSQGIASGDPTGGMGGTGVGMQDGTYFRRIRPFVEGTYWENGEYRLILALENMQYGTSGLDEFWVGAKDIPVVNMCRIGHVKDPIGLEGDMTSSSRCMTFMERSSYSQAIELDQNFLTGVWFANTFFDERATCQVMAGRPDQGAATGAYFGDGQGAFQSRFTCLPLYEDEGRHLLHLGASLGWRDGQSSGSNINGIQLRSRPELRDDDPSDGSGGTSAVPNGSGNRMLDTGFMISNTEYILGTEMLYVRGPFSFQAEYGWSFVDGVTGVAAALPTSAGAPAIIATPGGAQNYCFSGGYLQVAYTLTGENRAYDKRLGTLARAYYGPQGPYEKAFITRGPDGTCCWGLGSWELALRYSYLDLNSGIGTDRIQGGEMEGLTLGLNWVMNQNFELMFDYVNDFRYDTPVATTGPLTFNGTAANSTATGAVQGFGIRAQLQF
jgi:phosphate-selective porin OprO/OprP